MVLFSRRYKLLCEVSYYENWPGHARGIYAAAWHGFGAARFFSFSARTHIWKIERTRRIKSYKSKEKFFFTIATRFDTDSQIYHGVEIVLTEFSADKLGSAVGRQNEEWKIHSSHIKFGYQIILIRGFGVWDCCEEKSER